jgi:hypothetical protein
MQYNTPPCHVPARAGHGIVEATEGDGYEVSLGADLKRRHL